MIFAVIELLLLDLIPKDKVKLVQSLKAFFGTLGTGVLMICVGLLWSHTINAIWYAFFFCFAFAFVCWCIVVTMLNN